MNGTGVHHGTTEAPYLTYRYRLVPPIGFEYVSPSVTSILGYSPDDHYADPHLGTKIIVPDDLPLVDAIARASDGVTGPVVVRCRHKNGTLVWTEQRVTPIRDESGHLIGLEGVVVDLTRRTLEAVRRGPVVSNRGTRAPLDCLIEDAADAVLLAVRGEVDLTTVPLLRRHLADAAARGRHVVVDLSDAVFYDASGLRALVAGQDLCRARDRLFLIAAPSPRVARIIDIAALDRQIPIAPSRHAALEFIRTRANV